MPDEQVKKLAEMSNWLVDIIFQACDGPKLNRVAVKRVLAAQLEAAIDERVKKQLHICSQYITDGQENAAAAAKAIMRLQQKVEALEKWKECIDVQVKNFMMILILDRDDDGSVSKFFNDAVVELLKSDEGQAVIREGVANMLGERRRKD